MSLLEGKVAVVVPALDEAGSIAEVVSRIKNYALPIVVDDGSSDRTGAIAAECGAHVVTHAINLGYEQALTSGIERAGELGYSYVVTFDADGQHKEETLKEFILHLAMGFDVVVGRRDCMQRLGESVFATIGAWLWGLRDPLCGIKGFAISALVGVQDRYPFDSIGTKFVIDPVRRGRNFVELPVITAPRDGKSRLGPAFRVNMKIFKVMFRMIFGGRTSAEER